MVAIIGRDIGLEILELLGLETKRANTIKINIPCGDIVTVDVKYVVEQKGIDSFFKSISKTYYLTEKKDRNDTDNIKMD